MFLLIHDISVDLGNLAMTIRKGTIALLPLKSSFNESFVVYPFG
jgi:hypothetical protein